MMQVTKNFPNNSTAGRQLTIFDAIEANAQQPKRRGRPKNKPIEKTGPGRKLTADELATERQRYGAEGYNRGKQREKILDRIRELTKEHKKAPWRRFAIWLAQQAVGGIGWDPTVEDYLMCHTSPNRMAEEFGKSRRMIMYYLGAMEAAGLLVRDSVTLSAGRNHIRTMPKYVLTLGVLPELNCTTKASREIPEVAGVSQDAAEFNCTHTIKHYRKAYGNRTEKEAVKQGYVMGSNEVSDECLGWLNEKGNFDPRAVKAAISEPYYTRNFLNENWERLSGKRLTMELQNYVGS